MNKQKSCRTCKFADWPKSKNGRRLFQQGGKCTYVVDMPKIPQCVNGWACDIEKIKDLIVNRRAVFDNGGKECECHEPEGKT